MATISFQQINVTYPTASGVDLCALHDFNLDITEGESVVLLGPSGCGKSTALRLACGLQTPNAGRVLLNGEPLEEPRKNTALILQDYGLLPWKTVYQNAELGLLIQGVEKSERAARTAQSLIQVGLAGFEQSYPKELSGGMQQRLALARALALAPDTILMDEPLSALDALLREELQDVLLSLWQTRHHTQVIVTHSIEEAAYLGQKIYLISPRPGHIVSAIDNPSFGIASARDTKTYLDICAKIRTALKTQRAEEVAGDE